MEGKKVDGQIDQFRSKNKIKSRVKSLTNDIHSHRLMAGPPYRLQWQRIARASGQLLINDCTAVIYGSSLVGDG